MLVAVAVLLVIAISVGVTLFFTRDGSGGGGPTETSTPPTASGIASANDTGPVAIITSDPTCDGWRPLQNALAASQSEGWRQRSPTTPASEWTPDQRAQFEAAGNGMRATSDQALDLAKRTPHRVMRELYEQFVAYGRAYAESLATYVPDDDLLSRVNVSLSRTISTICDAIGQGNVIGRASTVPAAQTPSDPPDGGFSGDPERFLTGVTRTCADWVVGSASFEAELQEWSRQDTQIPATSWTPEQRSVQETAADAFTRYASKIEQLGRGSGNPVFEDFATLSALYFRAYANSTSTYTAADDYVVTPGLRLNNAIASACQATAK
ncbi:hypothetical protein [Mycobacterium sp. RTGN6]|uniref:hypothetical protein n=1 Tax=Mycobacterium sp. RTGN6 TaxID=3016521 RepID=UPI0029C802E1|nr:hypothetical protein [Mycobacterium sp. RTGN6]